MSKYDKHTRARSERVVRLKDELNRILELVVHSRESLVNELDNEIAQKKLSIDTTFLKKLKELTACYNSLTDARIRLDKAEKSLEEDLTPMEEREAALDYIKGMDDKERAEMISELIAYHKQYVTMSRAALPNVGD